MMHLKTRMMTAGVLLAMAGSAKAQLNQLFVETWETFQLGPSIDENVNTRPTAFDPPNTPVPNFFFGDLSDFQLDSSWSANGWTMIFDVPEELQGVGTAEWQGWAIADKLKWEIAAEDQERSQFTLGSGNVAVADPDEWDDFDILDRDPDQIVNYNTSLTSPVISLVGTDPNSAILRFESSWRPEEPQEGEVLISFDGGEFTRILRWSSDENDPDYHTSDLEEGLNTLNELVSLNLNNPESVSTVQIRFLMPVADNDWWWAIDNVEVLASGGEPISPPTDFEITNLQFVNPGSTITWQLSANAVDYDVTIANDENFQDVVESATVEVTSFVPSRTSLLPGAYYIRVVANNDQGSATATTRVGVGGENRFDLDGNGTHDAIDDIIFQQAAQEASNPG